MRERFLTRALVRLVGVGVSLALFVVVAAVQPWANSQVVLGESTGPEMALSITDGEAWFCFDTDCYVETDSSFELAVDVVEAPEDGYVLFQTAIDFGIYDPTASEDGAGANSCGDGIDNGDPHDGRDRLDDDCVVAGLTYEPAEDPADEIVWEDESGLVVRGELATGLLNHGGITAFTLPLPVSTYEGPLVVVEMTCPSSPKEVDVEFLPSDNQWVGPDGSVFVDDELDATIPKLTGITVHCVTKQSDPGDTDEDGCSDVAENGNDETEGGLRDYLNPWDFFDTDGDQYITLQTDILGVGNRYGTYPGGPPNPYTGLYYDEAYDRGPVPEGGDDWDMTAPDGIIDDIDVDGVFAQYQHDCS